ncbi:hypothetical protein A0J61_02957 [Choanephora cucurbitarum]|uniref:Uncharacterized protein n=1 Tax=Choanephora cucurbitarum TaxID=101091 RepID=A0A1C7NIT4_9FUNG|nr:hypothetical protein A0J61_02957 [Choanephora cucurbitarum]
MIDTLPTLNNGGVSTRSNKNDIKTPYLASNWIETKDILQAYGEPFIANTTPMPFKVLEHGLRYRQVKQLARSYIC